MDIEIGAKNRILRGKAREVTAVNQEIRELVRKMRKIMREANGIGLAAPQVGLLIRVFVAEVNKKSYVFINPELVKTSKDKDVLEEGCLSLPGLFGPVGRSIKVTLIGLDQHGKKVKIKASGLLARILQHEMDHLNGTLFIDKAKEIYEYKPEK